MAVRRFAIITEADARLLEPGGRIARFWNYHVVEPGIPTEFEATYAELAPTLTVIGRDPSKGVDAPDPFHSHAAFTTVRPRTYRWQRRLSSAEWTGLIATFGDDRRLARDHLARLTSALQQAVDQHGGTVDVAGGTYLLLAHHN